MFAPSTTLTLHHQGTTVPSLRIKPEVEVTPAQCPTPPLPAAPTGATRTLDKKSLPPPTFLSAFRGSGTLSPPLALPAPRTDPTVQLGASDQGIALLGNKYLLLEQLEGSNLHRCVDVGSHEEVVCKTVRNDPSGQALLSAHYRVDGHAHVNPIREVVVGDTQIYLFFPPHSIDLHSYVRSKRRLREPQARQLFRQIALAVQEAHSKGIVLRDLKLRKFVFTNETRSHLKLESLEDAIVLDDESDDLLSDKHGCPAYVSPEILRSNAQYSGRAADMWGLGVMLYTMLVGRYPFHGQEHTGLFAKIRRGNFSLPDSLSSRAKCLIRCLLRKDPADRLTTEDVLRHPWITQPGSRERIRKATDSDHAVPNLEEYKEDV